MNFLSKSKTYRFFGVDRSIRNFICWAIFGIAFSMSVILTTIGVMEGFEKSLRENLRDSTGDILITSENGFFKKKNYKQLIEGRYDKAEVAEVINSQGFLINDKITKGAALVGIRKGSFLMKMLDYDLAPGEIILGKELAHSLGLNIGDTVTVLRSKSNIATGSQLPPIELSSLRLVKTHQHNIYEKDARVSYVEISFLEKEASNNMVNSLHIKLDKEVDQFSSDKSFFLEKMHEFDLLLDYEFNISPYWEEFSTLIEAVEIEKISILVILQVIVIVAIFNVVAFFLFIREKKSQEIFVLNSLGILPSKMLGVWCELIIFIWLGASSLSIFLVKLYGLALSRLQIFNLPEEIYHLGRLELEIQRDYYLIIFGVCLLWLLLVVTILNRKFRQSSLLKGLRQEFS